MSDVFSRTKRSSIMHSIGSTDTKAELVVRKIINQIGIGYSKYSKQLAGKPDLIFHKRKKIIFINGCFWHQHENCSRSTMPSSNRNYWKPKLANNVARDKLNEGRLRRDGWGVMKIWECQTKPSNKEALKSRLIRFLGAT